MSKSEFEKDIQSRKDFVQVGKIKDGAKNIYAEQKKNEPAPAPLTSKQKRQNFWYYHKYKVVFTSFALLLASWLLYTAITAPEFDEHILFSANYSFDWYQDKLEKGFSKLSSDVNGDGKVLASVVMVNIKKPTDPQANNEFGVANKAKLFALLKTGNEFLFLIDDTSYSHITDNIEQKVFCDLESIFPENEKVKGDRYSINGSDFENLFDMPADDRLPKDMTLCIRNPEVMDKTKLAENRAKYENALKLLTKIIEYKEPTKK